MRASETRTMSRTPAAGQLRGIGNEPASGIPAPTGPALRMTRIVSGVMARLRVVDARGDVLRRLEDHRRAFVDRVSSGVAAATFIDGAVGGQRCRARTASPPGRLHRVRQRPDRVGARRRSGAASASRSARVPPSTTAASRSQVVGQDGQQRRAPHRRGAGPPGSRCPAGFRSAMHRHAAGPRELVEVVQGATPARRAIGQQMDHRVGGAADGRQHDQRVVQRAGVTRLRIGRRSAPAPRPTATRRPRPGAQPVAGGRRCGRRTGQRQPHRLHDAGHRRGRAHHHAGAAGGRQRLLDLGDLVLVQLAGTVLGPHAAAVGAGAEPLAAPRARSASARPPATPPDAPADTAP